jgi:hypothetical protein
MTRLVTSDNSSIDLLIAPSDIEAAVVAVAEPLEVLTQIILAAARVGT